MITKGAIKMEVRHFIRNYKKPDVDFKIVRTEFTNEVDGLDITLSSCGQGVSIPLDTVYDADGDEVDPEVFVEEIKAIVDAHNEKYKNE